MASNYLYFYMLIILRTLAYWNPNIECRTPGLHDIINLPTTRQEPTTQVTGHNTIADFQVLSGMYITGLQIEVYRLYSRLAMESILQA